MSHGNITWGLAGVYVVALVALLKVKVDGQGDLDHKGRWFLVGFLENNSSFPPELLIISQTDVTAIVTVRVPGLSDYSAIRRTLVKDQVLGIKLGQEVRMQNGAREKKGIEILSTSDIVVYGVNPVDGDSRDVFLALPVPTIGDEYYVASYKPNATLHLAQVGIIAPYNGTGITVTVPQLHRGLQVACEGKNYGEGSTIQLVLDAYDTVHLESEGDLTGIKIVATRPVSMVSGDTLRLESEEGEVWYDHFVEQLTPTHSWGKSFVSMAFSDGTTTPGDIFRVIASQNDTKIAVKDKRSLSTVTLAESEHAEMNVSSNEYITIEADKPVLVLQYLIPDASTSKAKSFVLTVPPSEHGESQYLFSIVSSAQQTVTLVVNASKTDAVLLDGQRIKLTLNTTSVTWVLVEGATADYAAIQLPVQTGFHNLTHVQHSPDSVFTAVSHGYPLGGRLKEHQAVPYHVINGDTGSDVRGDAENVVVADTGYDNTGYDVINDKTKPDTDTGNDVITSKSSDSYVVKMVAKGDGEVNFHETPAEEYSGGGEGLSATVIAVIVSLASAVFFVIACIVGFLAAEFVCRKENFPSAKVSPYIE